MVIEKKPVVPPAINLKCPHCQNPIEVVAGAHQKVECGSCGSAFWVDPDCTIAPEEERGPVRLGKFELGEEVGQGAFGTVYRARDTVLQRTVAIKVPRHGQIGTKAKEELFVREARNAAQLQHPGIVPVYEVGHTDTLPYIVSEFVEGVTLADALTARGMAFRESAKLMLKVAAAVQHAHENGVVHRDLKPSNIMLMADGVPRVMDFGLAKRDAGEITMTAEGQLLGTPAYMSPEQASGHGHHADGRSDVYSLGCIFYELLTGELPFRGNQRMLLHQVLHDEPRSLRSLNDRIPRDLETICLTAMAKEPNRRYQTAQALANDLQRYLEGQPIAARPVGRIERSWRWCRRNPMVAALSTAVAVALLAGTSISTYFAIVAEARASEALAEKTKASQKAAEAESERANAVAAQKLEAQQRERAEEAEARATEDARRASIEAEKAKQISQFLANMFQESAPFELMGLRFDSSSSAANLTAREILDRGAQRVATELQDQPLVQAALKETMGNVYFGLGLVDKAEALQLEAHQTRQQQLPHDDLDVASSLHNLGLVRFFQGRFGESADAVEEALNIRRKLLGDDSPLVDSTRMTLAVNLGMAQPHGESDNAVAVTLARESLAWRRKHFGNAHLQTALSMVVLAGALLNVGGNVESGTLILQATPIFLSDPGTRPVGIALTQMTQAELMIKLKRPKAEVLTATHKALAALDGALPDDHPFMLGVRITAAQELVYCEELDEAEKLYRDCLAFARKRHFEIPQQLCTILLDLCRPLEDSDPARAEALYRDALEITRASMAHQREINKDGRVNVLALATIARGFAPFLRDTDRAAEAEQFCREVLEIVRKNGPEIHLMSVLSQMGQSELDLGHYAEATTLLQESLQIAERYPFAERSTRANWVSLLNGKLGTCALRQGKKIEAEVLYRKALNEKDPTTWREPWVGLFNLLKAQGADKETLVALVKDGEPMHAGVHKEWGLQSLSAAGMALAHGRLLCELEEFGAAEKLLREGVEIRSKLLPQKDWRQGLAQSQLGHCLASTQRYDEAEPLLLSGYANLTASLGPENVNTREAAQRLVHLYEGWQKPEKAEEYRSIPAAEVD